MKERMKVLMDMVSDVSMGKLLDIPRVWRHVIPVKVGPEDKLRAALRGVEIVDFESVDRAAMDAGYRAGLVNRSALASSHLSAHADMVLAARRAEMEATMTWVPQLTGVDLNALMDFDPLPNKVWSIVSESDVDKLRDALRGAVDVEDH